MVSLLPPNRFDTKFAIARKVRDPRSLRQKKKATKKGNMDGAQIYVENAICKKTKQMSYLHLASQLDAVVARFDTQARITTINKSMASIIKSLMLETMDQLEKLKARVYTGI